MVKETGPQRLITESDHDYAVDYSNGNGSLVEVGCLKYAQW